MVNKAAKYTGILVGLALIAYLLGLEFRQAASLMVLGGMIGATLMFWRFRLVFAFFALAFMLGANLLEIDLLIKFAHLDTILFLATTMVIVGYLEDARFFEVIIDNILEKIGNRPTIVVVFIIGMSALLSSLVGEVTSILIMMAILMDITSRYNVNPIRFIMLSVFATNIGSAATVVGNPVGVMIAFQAGLSFFDFLRWATPISIASLLLCIVVSLYIFKKDIDLLAQAMSTPTEKVKAMVYGNGDKYPDIRLPAVIFLLTIAGLVLHTPLEQLLGLGKNSMLLGIPMLFAGVVLMFERERAWEIVERRIDWWTLLFFMIFFASVGTLSHTGATNVFAEIVQAVGGDSLPILMVLLTVAGGLMSALMDNVLAVATWIPIIKALGEGGLTISPLWWSMLFAGTFFGNLTIIGSTANIVAVGMLEKRERIHLTHRQWIGAGAAVTIPTVVLALLLLFLQLPFMT